MFLQARSRACLKNKSYTKTEEYLLLVDTENIKNKYYLYHN